MLTMQFDFFSIINDKYDFIATKSWMTYNSKLKKYCVEYIINKTYMSTSKSKV